MAADAILEDLVRDQPRILYASHFEGRGVDLFRLVCEQDLEGIVCKHRNAPYASESVPWIKVLNPSYSQREGRRENVRAKACCSRNQVVGLILIAVVVRSEEDTEIIDFREILRFAIAHDLPLLFDPARDRKLDEMIAMGWGSVPQTDIPPDWRTRRGPGA